MAGQTALLDQIFGEAAKLGSPVRWQNGSFLCPSARSGRFAAGPTSVVHPTRSQRPLPAYFVEKLGLFCALKRSP